MHLVNEYLGLIVSFEFLKHLPLMRFKLENLRWLLIVESRIL